MMKVSSPGLLKNSSPLLDPPQAGEHSRGSLSRNFWDSPLPSHSKRSPPALSTPSSAQRLRPCGFDENAQTDHGTPSKGSKGEKKCKESLGSPLPQDAAKTTGTPSAAAVALSDLFADPKKRTSGAASFSHGKKAILLCPRLSTAPLPITEGTVVTLPPKSPCANIAHSHKVAPPSLRPREAPPAAPPLSPLRPPYALTPTVLYDHVGYRPRPASAWAAAYTPRPRQAQQYYHQSPHWSGQVRVNPFSPVPEQYLRPHQTAVVQSARRHRRGEECYGFPTHLDRPPNLAVPLGEDASGLVLDLPHTRKKARPIQPRASPASTRSKEDGENEVSPTDAMHSAFAAAADVARKRTAPPPPTALDPGLPLPRGVPRPRGKRARVKRGRYLDDFQEVRFLGAGSFGAVHACLSRLDGCMYAVKSVGPGRRRGRDAAETGAGTTSWDNEGRACLGSWDGWYGGRQMQNRQCAMPPTPRRNWVVLSPEKRKKSVSRCPGLGEGGGSDDDVGGCGYDVGVLEGSAHWNEGALRRMLREVFALAALCQQDDFRTFHIVRYQQAWLEDDGTLYIQTELCAATLRDELSGKAGADAAGHGVTQENSTGREFTANSSATAMDVFRQLKLLREVLLALELVHQQGMVHLDIKPENIMVKNDLYKLGDFGLANVFTKEGRGGGRATTATEDIEEGDSRYMSKDLLDFKPQDLTKCDIFSLGVTMYEVCTGRLLPSCGQEWQDLRNGKPPTPVPRTTLPCLAATLREMMHPDPKKRPSATELLSREMLGGGFRGSNDGMCPFGNPLPLGGARKRTPYKMGASTMQMKPVRPSLKRSASWASI